MRVVYLLCLLLLLGTAGWAWPVSAVLTEQERHCEMHCECYYEQRDSVQVVVKTCVKDEAHYLNFLLCRTDLEEAVQKMVKVNAMLTMYDDFAKDRPFLYGQELLIRVLRAQIAGIDELAARCAPEKGKE